MSGDNGNCWVLETCSITSTSSKMLTQCHYSNNYSDNNIHWCVMLQVITEYNPCERMQHDAAIHNCDCFHHPVSAAIQAVRTILKK